MLAGDLSEFTLQDIFQLLGLTRKTGALRIAHAGGEGQVLVHEGNVCFAVADGERLPLAARLVASGLVDADTLSEAIEAHRADGPMTVAANLLGRDDVDGPTVDDAVREQVTDALFVLLQASSGTFEFDHRAALASEWPREPVAGDALLEEARKRLERWEELRERVPSPESRVALAPSPPGDGPVEIDREAWRLLVLVDGQRTVDELANLAGTGAFAVGELLADLVDSGVVEVVADGERSSLDQLLDSRRSLDKLSRLDGGRARASGGARSGDSRSRVAGDGSAAGGDRSRGGAAPASRPASAPTASAGSPEKPDASPEKTADPEPATASSATGEEARGVVLNSLPPDDTDPEEASRRAIADTRAAAFRDQGPQQEPAQRHRAPDADSAGDGGRSSSTRSAAGQGQGQHAAPSAKGSAAPQGTSVQTQDDPAGAEAGKPGNDSGVSGSGEDQRADDQASEETEEQEQDDEKDAEASAGSAGEMDAQASAGSGAAAGSAGGRSAGRLDRAQVARELASLGLDDNGGGGRTRNQARNSDRGDGAGGSSAGGASGDDDAAAQPGAGSASAPAAPVSPAARATHMAATGPTAGGGQATGAAAAAEALPEQEEAPEPEETPADGTEVEKDEQAASLRRDERVDRGLLLRLIDGVQDA